MLEPPLQPIPVGSLSATLHPHLIGLEKALIASDCFTDDGSIQGRSAYRSLLPGAVTGAGGSGSGTGSVPASGNPQFIGRFQPTLASDRTVLVIGGSIYLCTDASSPTASDGVSSLLAANVFGANDNISGRQLGENFYLSTDNATAKWVRITSAYALQTLAQLPTAEVPSYTVSTLDLIYLNSLSVATSGITITTTSVTNWEQLAGSTGSTAIYDLTSGGGPAAGYNWMNTTWLMLTVSPETISGGGTNFSVDLEDANGVFYPLGTVSDPPNTNGSPWAAFFNMSGLGITANIKHIRFTQGVKASGSGADPFCVSAFMAFPTAPEPGTVDYFVVYSNSVTGARSALSLPLPITYSSIGVTFPATAAGRWNYNTFSGIGVRSTNPDSMSVSDLFNKGQGLAFPKSTDFAPVYTFFDTIPASAQFPATDTVQLYRTTPVGNSLVGACITATRADGSAWTGPTAPTPSPLTGTASDVPLNYTLQTAGNTAWSITDNGGISVESNPVYQPGGPGPRTTGMAVMADRLIAFYGNTMYFSSFTPMSLGQNEIPQWPAIAVEDSNGWNFDITPAPNEAILDAQVSDPNYLYILTSARVMGMRSLTPGTTPFPVRDKGTLGRRSACVTENQLWWESYDGIYGAIGQSGGVELTGDIRVYLYNGSTVRDQSLVLNPFTPTASAVMAFQNRKLYAFQGQQYLRYDFVTQSWTTGTLADNVVAAWMFNFQQPETEEVWFLTSSRFVGRLQPTCFRDMQIGTDTTTGTAPPDWVYSTGFDVQKQMQEVAGLEFDVNGFMQGFVAGTLAALPPIEARPFKAIPGINQDETWYPGYAQFVQPKMRVQMTAANNVTMARALWERNLIDKKP